MNNFLKVGTVNVLPLLLEIKSQPELWNKNRLRKDRAGSPHCEMDDIWIRYNDIKNEGPEFNDEHDSVWYPSYYSLPSARSLIFDLMANVYGERLGGILITKIPPGGSIAPHTDDSWHVRYYDKFYISLESTTGANFSTETEKGIETVCPDPGDVYWFDNKNRHWVVNNSTGDRMTLIVCIKTQRFGERSEN